MKNTITNSLVAMLLLVMGVVGCRKNNTLPDNPNNPDNNYTTRTPMSITVNDGGYSDNNSRAVENGYAKDFIAGDKIGFYVVVEGRYVHKNIALTLTDIGDGKLEWQAPSGTTLYYESAAAKYFAYYPYQASLTGDLVPSANTAVEFFTNVASAWTLDTDQSTHAKYIAQDLMIGSGTANKQGSTYSLALTMTHAMALVVIETPSKKYTFTNDNPTVPDYDITVTNRMFNGFKPYSTSVGTYRYLVKPGQSGADDLKGSYTKLDGTTKEYDIAQNNISAGKYQLYKVDGGITSISHNLQAGDFYLKDGSLLRKDTQISDEQKAACIGIVYWVVDATEKDQTLKNDHPECTHGLVVSLKEEVNMIWQEKNLVSVQEWLDNNQNGKFLPVKSDTGPNDLLNNIQGYNNTKAIETFNFGRDINNSFITAVQKAVDYRTEVPAPSISSDWYIPSGKELSLLCGKHVYSIWGEDSGTDNRNLINKQLSSIGCTELSEDEYFSSSEYSLECTYCVVFARGAMGAMPKGNSNSVRFSLAF